MNGGACRLNTVSKGMYMSTDFPLTYKQNSKTKNI